VDGEPRLGQELPRGLCWLSAYWFVPQRPQDMKLDEVLERQPPARGVRPGDERLGEDAASLSSVAATQHPRAHGHHRGRGVKARFDIPFAMVWELRDDKPIRFTEYQDTATTLQAIED